MAGLGVVAGARIDPAAARRTRPPPPGGWPAPPRRELEPQRRGPADGVGRRRGPGRGPGTGPPAPARPRTRRALLPYRRARLAARPPRTRTQRSLPPLVVREG